VRVADEDLRNPFITGHQRAQAKFPEIGVCEMCPEPARDRHHIDGNTLNNEPGNVSFLCRRCHMKGDGRLDALVEIGQRKKPRSPKRPCVVCRGMKKPLRRGRCHACNEYWRRHGIERSEYLARRTEPVPTPLTGQ